MWTAEIKSVTKENGWILVNVGYSNGEQSFEESYKATNGSGEEWLKGVVRQKINSLEAVDTIYDTLNAKVGQPIDVSVPEPTREELERQALAVKRLKIQSLKIDLDLGLIDQVEYDAQATTILNS